MMSYILENCKTIPRNKANRYLPQHVVILASQNDVALGVVELLKAALEIPSDPKGLGAWWRIGA